MFLADSDIKSSLAGLLKTTPDQLQPYYDTIIADGHQWAYNEIVTALVSRAFSLGQIQAWDRGGEYEKSLACFWCLTQGGVAHDYDDKFITRLDRRLELIGDESKGIKAVAITNSQQFQAPTGTVGRPVSNTNLGTQGRIGYGVQDTSRDTYTTGGFKPPLLPTPGYNPW